MKAKTKPHYFRAPDSDGRYWWWVRIGPRIYGGWASLPFGEIFR